MNFACKVILCGAVLCVGGFAWAQQKEIPVSLRPWTDWATWQDKHANCPSPYNKASEHLCFWPSRLSLTAEPNLGTWSVEVTLFAQTWVPLPGSDKNWPLDVHANDQSLAVISREGQPCVQLPVGQHTLSGRFHWDTMPQWIAIPKQIGLLSLVVRGQTVRIPNWDAQGHVWLKRIRAEVADKDLLAVQVYRVIEDGIPNWLQTQIELTISGKSREEQLGWVLPQGWQLAQLDSSIPVAVDEQGRMKAQVRAGKWKIDLRAFRSDGGGEFGYATEAEPIVDNELIGFRAKSEFRLVELEGIPVIDVTQTTFPQPWRNLPVYRWQTSSPFQLVEKMRGMGLRRPEGLKIERQFWLDEDGQGLTYCDRIQGRMQQIWRLNVSDLQQLGAVRIDGEGQLITIDPHTGAEGVEIRNRNLNLEAVGRIDRTRELSAVGWQTAADSLGLTLTLPPGWRVFALFGPDQVDGDWLTTWTLLDLFLLLIFSLAVWRQWGSVAGIVALLAFGLAYHEPGAPRLTWLFLLMPLALLRVMPPASNLRWLLAWKYLATTMLILCLVPFVARQIQTAIYPQLERPGIAYSTRGVFWPWTTGHRRAARMSTPVVDAAPFEAQNILLNGLMGVESAPNSDEVRLGKQAKLGSEITNFNRSNMQQELQAKIQTGPAKPEWSWNQVTCRWDGPVTTDQQIDPILISLQQHRLLTALRLTLLLLLAAILLGVRTLWKPFSKRTLATVVVLFTGLLPGRVEAQFPDSSMLDTLRQRLLEPADAFPQAADIPQVKLQVFEDRIVMEAEIHAALEVAVPLPGRLPTWSPMSVRIDDQSQPIVCRKDGYLWVLVPAGVHQVVVEGLLPPTTDWEWTYLLKPRHISIVAPQWEVTGLRPDGVVEQQVFFSRKQKSGAGLAAYDRKDFQTLVVVNRHLEIGLIWQVHTEVSRLNPNGKSASLGKAVALNLPLLPGESVLTSNVIVNNGQIEVRIGAGQGSVHWQSELPVNGELHLSAQKTDRWVERWHLVTSPVWNAEMKGLAPVYQSQQQRLVPVWYPWPGESVTLSFSKPAAVSGDTVTVQQVHHEVTVGSREQASQLKLNLQCSLGSDFIIDLATDADISSLQQDGRAIPVRRDDRGLIVPVHPGRQTVEINWRTSTALTTVTSVEPVKLPVAGANVFTVLRIPESRWILWADGPLRGPAVRFWTILASALLAAWVLGSLPLSPLSRLEWALLAIGLTQVHVTAAMLVVGWLFLLAWRGKRDPDPQSPWRFNLMQIWLVFLTMLVLGVLVAVVGEGLLGNPDMFIRGNHSTRTILQWFQPRIGMGLPEPHIVSVSVWFYRLLMLFWALWLATALLRWLGWGWNQFQHGSCWLRRVEKKATL
ncbi:MAG: hypothetical protein ABGX16_12030 [Pirellulales bacterium]